MFDDLPNLPALRTDWTQPLPPIAPMHMVNHALSDATNGNEDARFFAEVQAMTRTMWAAMHTAAGCPQRAQVLEGEAAWIRSRLEAEVNAPAAV